MVVVGILNHLEIECMPFTVFFLESIQYVGITFVFDAAKKSKLLWYMGQIFTRNVNLVHTPDEFSQFHLSENILENQSRN